MDLTLNSGLQAVPHGLRVQLQTFSDFDDGQEVIGHVPRSKLRKPESPEHHQGEPRSRDRPDRMVRARPGDLAEYHQDEADS